MHDQIVTGTDCLTAWCLAPWHMLPHVATCWHTLTCGMGTWKNPREDHGRIKGEQSHGATEPRSQGIPPCAWQRRTGARFWPGSRSRHFPVLSGAFPFRKMTHGMTNGTNGMTCNHLRHPIASHHIPFDRTCERNVTLWHLHVATHDNDWQCTSVTISLLIPILLDLPKSA
jgi:hypothetical protein